MLRSYLFEFSDPSSYAVHKYWTPSAQKSIKEGIIVSDFVSYIYSILDIDELRNDFKREYLKNGCYNDGGMLISCIDSKNSYGVGYSGSGKLPVGYLANVRFNYWGGISLNINHQFNRHREYDFSGEIIKSNLFIKNSKGRNDFIRYIYRTQRLQEEDRIQNHNIMYGINIRSTSVALGADFLCNNETKTGGAFLIQQYLSVMKISLSAQTYVYKDLINYKFQTSKLIYSNTYYLRYIYLNLYFENFVKQQNIGWSVSIDF